MATIINGQGDVEFTDNELVKEMIDDGETTAAKNFVFDNRTNNRVSKNSSALLKRALAFCVSCRKTSR